MVQRYTPILTTVGINLILDSIANGTPIVLKYFAWGDGGGYPTPPNQSQTSLINEVYRKEIDVVTINPEVSTWLDIITFVPNDVGGFYVREVGIFTESNELFAVGEHPEFYKNLPEDGTVLDFRERLILEITNLTEVNIELSPTVGYATIEALNEHKHIGGVGNPSKIDLSSEVENILPGSQVSGVLYTDGSNSMSGDLNMDNNSIKNLNEPEDLKDPVTLNYFNKLRFRPQGFTTSNATSDPNNLLLINTGLIKSRSGDIIIETQNAYEKDLSGTWTPGDGNGGLGNGLSKTADTTYFVFALSKPDGSQTDYGYDTDIDATNLLALSSSNGLTEFERVNVVETDSSGNIVPTNDIELPDGSLKTFYKPKRDVIDDNAPPTTLTSLYVKVPKGINVEAGLLVSHTNQGNASHVELYSNYTETSIEVLEVETTTTNEAGEVRDGIFNIYTDTNGEIQYRRTDGTTSNINIQTLYYIDFRM